MISVSTPSYKTRKSSDRLVVDTTDTKRTYEVVGRTGIEFVLDLFVKECGVELLDLAQSKDLMQQFFLLLFPFDDGLICCHLFFFMVCFVFFSMRQRRKRERHD